MRNFGIGVLKQFCTTSFKNHSTVETMRVGSELTLLTNRFQDSQATVVGELTAIHENIILMQVSTLLPPKWLARGGH